LKPLLVKHIGGERISY